MSHTPQHETAWEVIRSWPSTASAFFTHQKGKEERREQHSGCHPTCRHLSLRGAAAPPAHTGCHTPPLAPEPSCSPGCLPAPISILVMCVTQEFARFVYLSNLMGGSFSQYSSYPFKGCIISVISCFTFLILEIYVFLPLLFY